MPRSLSKEGVRHPLNPENFEFSHSLGQKQPFRTTHVYHESGEKDFSSLRELMKCPTTRGTCQFRHHSTNGTSKAGVRKKAGSGVNLRSMRHMRIRPFTPGTGEEHVILTRQNYYPRRQT